MDWTNVRGSQPIFATPTERTLETCWRMRGPSGRILSCAIVRDAASGLDVRAGYAEDDLLWSQRTAEIGTAREIAETWRQAVIAKGGFVEVSEKARTKDQFVVHHD
jgi:hypothetical protein